MSVIGIDTGGTFCDLVHITEDGRTHLHKAPSTPKDTAQGVFDVLAIAREAEKAGSAFDRGISSFALGTTIATNAAVTRTGAKVGLLTTRGHGDVLNIMRVNGRVAGRPLQEVQNYSVTSKPLPIVPRERIAEIDERIDFTGEVIVPLSDAQVVEAIDRLVGLGAECLAVSFLWGFHNPQHERRVQEIARSRHPDLLVSLGSDLVRRLGEYERTKSAVLNAYVAPTVIGYLDRVEAGLRQKDMRAPLLIMHSAGGVATDGFSRSRPIATFFSGPAGGIVASMRVAEAGGYRNIICADVGGTTFDVGLVVNGRPLLRSTTIVDQRVMYSPTIDIVSIGAGGGSIARVDPPTRRLMVGPQSAGALPGPACYGRGGEYPTVTDANLLLGYLDPDRFLGGRFVLDRKAAAEAIARHVAEPLGIDVQTAAAGVFSIVNAKMADLVRKVTVERGHDPREFVLCAYGGLGPLHAPFYAQDLHAKAVIVPLGELSSVFSAYGIAMADILHVHELSLNLREPFDNGVIDGLFEPLVRTADRQLEADNIDPADRQMRRFVEVRYVGQLNELVIELPAMARGDFDIRAQFERQYVEAFGPGASWKKAPVELVGLRLEAIGKRKKFPMARREPTPPARQRATRQVYWPQVKGFTATAIYDGNLVGAGGKVSGPAVLEFPTTTILVPPDWLCLVDEFGSLTLSIAANRQEGRLQ